MNIDPKIWIDRVRAVPIIGIHFHPSFEAAAGAVTTIAPVLREWYRVDPKMKVKIEDHYVLKIERSNGCEFTITSDKVVAKFYHLSTMKEYGQELPIVQYATKPQPVETLIALLVEGLKEILSAQWKDGNRPMVRIGVVTVGNLDKDAMPPGFDMFIKHCGSPWSAGVDKYDVNLTANLLCGTLTEDRCHHQLSNKSSEEEIITFSLDWQRAWHKGTAVPLKVLLGHIEECVSSALEYFGNFGLGALNYAPSSRNDISN